MRRNTRQYHRAASRSAGSGPTSGRGPAARSCGAATTRPSSARNCSVLREHGLTMTRSFFYWPDFMPEPDAIDEEMTARFADFLDRHAEQRHEHGPHVHRRPHVRGELGSGLAGGRDLYTDVWMVGRQAWFAGEMVRRFGPHPAVAGWLVSNEMPIYGGDHGAARDRRRLGADHQGRGARGRRPPAVLARRRRLGHRGDRPRERVPARRHRRGSATSSARTSTRSATTRSGSTTRPRWQCELAGTFGQPVVLEEFGVSSDFASDAERGPLLPARAAQQPAGRGDRLDRLEQHRLRPARPGPVPAPRLRAALRPHRRGRPAQGHAAARCAAFARHAGRDRGDPLRADRHRHRPDRSRLPGHQLPVHRPGRAARDIARRSPRRYVLGPAGRPAGRR